MLLKNSGRKGPYLLKTDTWDCAGDGQLCPPALASLQRAGLGADGMETEVRSGGARAEGVRVGYPLLACPDCGGRLRLIATLHDPAVIRKILATWVAPNRGSARAPPRPSPAPPRLRREASSVLIRPVHLPVDGGGVPA